MHDRDNLAPAPDGGFWKGASLAMLASTPLWGLIAWFIVSLWRAAPDLTTGDWVALACSTTLCWMGVRAGAKVWARKRRA